MNQKNQGTYDMTSAWRKTDEDRCREAPQVPRDSAVSKTQAEIAAGIAHAAHDKQFRRDGKTPYIEHPKAVAAKLSDDGDDTVATAWLHDVLEDSRISPDDLLQAGISKNVVEAVKTLTRGDEDYFDYLGRVKCNEIAKKVKIADMLHNLGDQPTERQIIKYAKGLIVLLENHENQS